MTKENFFIEVLDTGFILKNKGAQRAVETSEKLEQIIVDKFKDAIVSNRRMDTRNMTIAFEVDENVPVAVPREISRK